MDTGVFTGEQPMSEQWHRFREFVERVDELPVSLLVRRGCHTDPGDEVAAAYDAPFPSEASKAGARAFPAILPLRARRPGRRGRPAHAGRAARGRAADAAAVGRPGPRAARRRPARRSRARSGRPAPRVIADAGHFLQEDQGELVGAPDRRLAALRLGGGALLVLDAGPRPPSRRSGRSRRRATRRRARLDGSTATATWSAFITCAERLAGAPRQDRGDLQQRAGRARHEDVEARDLERADDLVGDLLRA